VTRWTAWLLQQARKHAASEQHNAVTELVKRSLTFAQERQSDYRIVSVWVAQSPIRSLNSLMLSCGRFYDGKTSPDCRIRVKQTTFNRFNANLRWKFGFVDVLVSQRSYCSNASRSLTRMLNSLSFSALLERRRMRCSPVTAVSRCAHIFIFLLLAWSGRSCF